MPSGHQVGNSEATFLSFIISYFEGLPFQNFSHVESRSEPNVNKRPTTPWAVLPPPSLLQLMLLVVTVMMQAMLAPGMLASAE